MDGPLSGQAWHKREYERTQRRGVQYPLRRRERGKERMQTDREGGWEEERKRGVGER